MAKTIKFNLNFDDYPVRSLDDLRKHFSIEDVLTYYNTQQLHRWLKVRGYDNELQKVSAITCTNALDIVKELISVFGIVADEQDVEECVYLLEHLGEHNDQTEVKAKHDLLSQSLLNTAQDKYDIKTKVETPWDEMIQSMRPSLQALKKID